MAKVTAYTTDANAVWNTAAWSNGIPNAIDDEAQLIGNLTAARTMTIPTASTYTVGRIYAADSALTYFDWSIAGSNATSSILNFETSSGIPTIVSADGGTYSVLLAGTQGLILSGGRSASDTLTISNLNNTLYGPLQFNYAHTSSITGKLTASGSISSTNNFANVSYGGILGLLGKVDLLNSGLNIRTTEILGNLDVTSELTTSNNSYVISNPDTFNTNLKISTPMVLASSNEQGLTNTPDIVIEYTGIISGISPAFNTSTISLFGIQTGPNLNASGSSILRLSNTANTFTGTSPSSHVSSFSDTVDATSILEYKTIANSGIASSLGAGTGYIMGAVRGSTYRCIGAGGTTNRQLVYLGGGTSNYSLENNGTGPIIFNNTTASTFGNQWPVLGGTNLDLNEISQPVYHPRPLVKDGPGRWVLSGEKRYLPVTAYNAGPKPWLTSTGRSLINTGYSEDFISVIGGYLRFNSSLDLRHQNTSATATSNIKIYSGSALELNGYNIPNQIPVGATATNYPVVVYLSGQGPAGDGALINVSGANTVSSPIHGGNDLDIYSISNIASQSLTLDNYIRGDVTLTGSGQIVLGVNSYPYLGIMITDASVKHTSYSALNSTILNRAGTLQLSSSAAAYSRASSSLNVSGGLTQILTSKGTYPFNDIKLNTGSLVHTLNSDLTLSGTILYANTTASSVFSYTYPTGRALKLIAGAGFGVSDNKTGSVDIVYDYSGSVQSNITTEGDGLLIIQSAYSSSTGYGFNKNGTGTVKLMSSASYAGTNNLSVGTIVPKHKNSFGVSSLVVQGGTLSTEPNMHVEMKSNLTLNGGTLVFGANV